MWPHPHFSADLVTFTEDILNGKLHLLYNVIVPYRSKDRMLYLHRNESIDHWTKSSSVIESLGYHAHYLVMFIETRFLNDTQVKNYKSN